MFKTISRKIASSIRICEEKIFRREKNIWQRRFWEHLIRDEDDFYRCLDYIYYNPVKHGYVDNPSDWPYSSFKRDVEKGLYESGWGNSSEPVRIKDLKLE